MATRILHILWRDSFAAWRTGSDRGSAGYVWHGGNAEHFDDCLS
jgi:hypothetical protein